MVQGADVTRLAWIRGGFYAVTALALVLRDARLRASPLTVREELPEPRIAA
jgi:hypothetical protein